MTKFQQKFEDAMTYLNFLYSHGAIDESEISELTKHQIIELADKYEAMADFAYEQWKERDIDETK